MDMIIHCTKWTDNLSKSVRVFAVAVVAMQMAGCAKEAVLQPINGQYYLVGDDSCQYASIRASDTINCFDSDKNPTGYRTALTPAQIQMYQYQQYNNQMQMQQLNQSLQQTGQSFQQAGQQFQQYQQYTPPAVTPIAPPGGNQVRCISTDIYTNCRY